MLAFGLTVGAIAAFVYLAAMVRARRLQEKSTFAGLAEEIAMLSEVPTDWADQPSARSAA